MFTIVAYFGFLIGAIGFSLATFLGLRAIKLI